MPKPRTQSGEKNLISQRLIELRKTHNMSQRDLAYKLQLAGYDMDKNVITRIETNKRYVTDLELKAIAEIFQVCVQYSLPDLPYTSSFLSAVSRIPGKALLKNIRQIIFFYTNAVILNRKDICGLRMYHGNR